ncbi:hypothetical protein [Deinococcus alpinitundrae]|uniref:hypothetical protein n=1 Tax=Deinococcus alpinitundrae TaxID=468913 RepID=UPI00137A4352|nr:hypothetical protein [Deinococcus alpinitundrae]
MENDKNYPNLGSLAIVEKILNETVQCLADPTRTTATSDIPEILGVLLGMGAGGAASAAWVSGTVAGAAAAGVYGGAGVATTLAGAGAVVGGGMLAGVAVLAAPMVVLGLAGYGVFSIVNQNRLEARKRTLLDEANKLHPKLFRQCSSVNLTNERLEYIRKLTILIRDIILRLQHDLGLSKTIFKPIP